jgi:hypothetical protein
VSILDSILGGSDAADDLKKDTKDIKTAFIVVAVGVWLIVALLVWSHRRALSAAL